MRGFARFAEILDYRTRPIWLNVDLVTCVHRSPLSSDVGGDASEIWAGGESWVVVGSVAEVFAAMGVRVDAQ